MGDKQPRQGRTSEAGTLCSRCGWCEKHGRSHNCPACTARRRAILSLHQDHGLDFHEIARRKQLDVRAVKDAILVELDQQELRRLQRDDVDNGPLRALLERRQRDNPDLSFAEVARRAGYADGTHVRRLLGYAEVPAAQRNGRRYRAYLRKRIPINDAERITRALGCAPAEFDRL